jgi:hypothetical protein
VSKGAVPGRKWGEPNQSFEGSPVIIVLSLIFLLAAAALRYKVEVDRRAPLG